MNFHYVGRSENVDVPPLCRPSHKTLLSYDFCSINQKLRLCGLLALELSTTENEEYGKRKRILSYQLEWLHLCSWTVSSTLRSRLWCGIYVRGGVYVRCRVVNKDRMIKRWFFWGIKIGKWPAWHWMIRTWGTSPFLFHILRYICMYVYIHRQIMCSKYLLLQ